MTDRTVTQVRAQTPLADYTTWRVGGPAEWLVEPSHSDEIDGLLAWARQRDLVCRVIGAGSNLLIHDDGLPGLTLCLRKLQGATIDANSGVVDALAGEPPVSYTHLTLPTICSV